MKPKRVLTAVLLLLVAASVGAMAVNRLRPGAAQAGVSDGVVVYWLHGSHRCVACRSVEIYSQETLTAAFAQQLEDGRLNWRIVDYDRPPNEHFKRDFNLVSPSMVLVEMRGGDRTRWKVLPEVLERAADQAVFTEFVQEQVAAFLKGSHQEPEQVPVMFFAAVASALWLGIQTAVSPCPMAANIAAVSFVGRRVGRPGQALFAGLLYALGRTLVYVTLAVLLAGSLLAISPVSTSLQKYMPQLLGPILILIGMFMLEMIRLGFSGPGVSENMQKRVERMGIWGALPLGVLLAAAFCPLPAALFFGGLIPLAVECNSRIALPLLYGVGTALPVVGFAVVVAYSAQSVGKAFNLVTRFEWWFRRIAGVVFLVVGIFFSLEFCFRIPIGEFLWPVAESL